MSTSIHGETGAAKQPAWEGFLGALWQKEINVRAFLQLNYTPYGDAAFLKPTTSHHEDLGHAHEDVRRGTQERRLDVSLIRRPSRHAPGHRPRARDHRRAPDRRAAQARDR
jgi:formate C-acetyltransferase